MGFVDLTVKRTNGWKFVRVDGGRVRSEYHYFVNGHSLCGVYVDDYIEEKPGEVQETEVCSKCRETMEELWQKRTW